MSRDVRDKVHDKIPTYGDCGDKGRLGSLQCSPMNAPMKTLARHLLDYLLILDLLALVLLVAASSASMGSWLAVSGN